MQVGEPKPRRAAKLGTRAQVIARQMRELLDRHSLTPSMVETLTAEDGEPPVSSVTVRRILNAEARTAPAVDTLERIAVACGESTLGAFSMHLGGPGLTRRRAGNAVALGFKQELVDEANLRRIAGLVEELLEVIERACVSEGPVVSAAAEIEKPRRGRPPKSIVD